MQFSQSLDPHMTGPQIKVIGVAENNLRFDFVFQLVGRNGFHGANSSDRHEDRSENLVRTASTGFRTFQNNTTGARPLDTLVVRERLFEREL